MGQEEHCTRAKSEREDEEAEIIAADEFQSGRQCSQCARAHMRSGAFLFFILSGAWIFVYLPIITFLCIDVVFLLWA